MSGFPLFFCIHHKFSSAWKPPAGERKKKKEFSNLHVQVAAAARAKAKEMRALPARKVRSGSKSKFSKPRKR